MRKKIIQQVVQELNSSAGWPGKKQLISRLARKRNSQGYHITQSQIVPIEVLFSTFFSVTLNHSLTHQPVGREKNNSSVGQPGKKTPRGTILHRVKQCPQKYCLVPFQCYSQSLLGIMTEKKQFILIFLLQTLTYVFSLQQGLIALCKLSKGTLLHRVKVPVEVLFSTFFQCYSQSLLGVMTEKKIILFFLLQTLTYFMTIEDVSHVFVAKLISHLT